MEDFDNDDLDFLASETLAEHVADELRDEVERLRAENEALRVDAGTCIDLVQLVEGLAGAINHGYWVDRNGLRLKDTREWVVFYSMTKKIDAIITRLQVAHGDNQ